MDDLAEKRTKEKEKGVSCRTASEMVRSMNTAPGAIRKGGIRSSVKNVAGTADFSEYSYLGRTFE